MPQNHPRNVAHKVIMAHAGEVLTIKVSGRGEQHREEKYNPHSGRYANTPLVHGHEVKLEYRRPYHHPKPQPRESDGQQIMEEATMLGPRGLLSRKREFENF